MGLSSSSSKTTPIYDQQITGAANTLKSVYTDQAPRIGEVSDQVTSLIPSLLDRYKTGDPALNAAQGYITSTLGGDPAHNPYIDQMIGQTNNDVANTTNAKLGTRGLTGGTVQNDILSRNLAQNETGLRYQDYSDEQARRAQAAAMAPAMTEAQSSILSPVFDAANAVTLPMLAAQDYASGTGGLLGQYTNTKSSQPWGSALLGAAASGLGSFVGAGGKFSDIRLKTDIRRVGRTDGGLPVYTYRYIDDPTVHMGVMAQDVAQEQPHALGPEVHGFATVNYGEVR